MSSTQPEPAKHLLNAEQVDALPEVRHVHQFNASAIRMTRNLGDTLGLSRMGLSLVRVEPGNESTTYHYHEADEEFIFILSGRGIADIGGVEQEIGAGDVMGFPTPSAPHTMRNPFSEDLVYLVGGERNELDVVHYPRLQRSMIKHQGAAGNAKQWMNWDDIHTV